MSRLEVTAHVLLRPIIEGLVESVRAATARVTGDREDAEAVHDSRVAIRRLRAALRAVGRLYGAKRIRELDDVCRRQGRALGGLRDAEVLEETLRAALPPEGLAPLEAWLEARRSHEKELRDGAIELLADGELEGGLDAVRALVAEGARHDVSLNAFARKCLADVEKRVESAIPKKKLVRENGDELFAALHRLRIRFKRKRYTAELLGELMDVVAGARGADRAREKAGARSIRYSVAAEDAAVMQRELGHLQDAHATLSTLRDDTTIDEGARAAAIEALGAMRARLLASSIAALERLEYL